MLKVLAALPICGGMGLRSLPKRKEKRMMLKTAYITTVLIALATLAGCAGNRAQFYADDGRYQANPKRSLALNVAVATGLTECRQDKCSPLYDVPRSELPRSLQTQNNEQIADALFDVYDIGYGAAQIGGIASAVGSLSGLASGLFNIADVLLGPTTRPDPALKYQVLAWMPKSMANDTKDAQAKLRVIYRNALPQGEFDGYQTTTIQTGSYGWKQPSHYVDFIKNNQASTDKRIYVSYIVREPYKVDRAPSWLGAGSSYAWLNWGRGEQTDSTLHTARIGFHVDSKNKENRHIPRDLNTRSYLARYSANLPQWVYIYLPPTDRDPYPVILNQGKPLLFVEPL